MYTTITETVPKKQTATGRFFWALLLPMVSGKIEPLIEGGHDLYESVEAYKKGLKTHHSDWQSVLILEENDITEDLVMLKLATGYTAFLRRVHVKKYWIDREIGECKIFDGEGWVV